MKSRASKLLAALALPALLSTLNSEFSTVHAQGTAFTYQGRLNDGVSPANGSYDLRFTIYDSPSGGLIVGGPLTNTATPVSNGLFTVTMDFGVNVFTGPARWLDIGVRTNGSAAASQTLSPRQELTAVPYSITAGNVTGVIPSGSLSGAYPGAVSFNNPANSFSGNGTGLTSLNASQLTSGTVPVAALGNAWQVGGNTGTSPTNGSFVGTSDFQPLELKVAGLRVLRLEPDPRLNGLSGNLIGGYTNNLIQQPGSGGDFIGGGGFSTGPNIVLSNSQGVFIGAGSANQIGPNVNDSFIGAGFGNSIGSFAYRSVISGGFDNTNNSSYSTIGGGYFNGIQVNASYGGIGGGAQNTIQNSASASVIAGGYFNTIQSTAFYGTIGGGVSGSIGSPYATISGGGYNSIGTSSDSGTISGGYNNTIGSNTFDSAIGGGSYHTIGSNSYYSTIAGGRLNNIGNNATASAIGGGFENTIANDAAYAVIPGGYINTALGSNSLAAGTEAQAYHPGSFVWADASDFLGFTSTANNQFSVRALGGVRFVTGGAGISVDGQIVTPLETVNDANHSNIVNVVNGSAVNFVGPGIYAATISGGGALNYDGTAYTNSILSDIGTIAGGIGNTIGANSAGSTISGGIRNHIQDNSFNAIIAGGADNTVQNGSIAATLSGGQNNTLLFGSAYSSLGGGHWNAIGGTGSVLGGGQYNSNSANYAVIAGGYHNSIQPSSDESAIGGGVNNNAGGYYSTIPGGNQNEATGNYSFAAGNQAEATNDGAFVWADSQNASFASTGTNQFLIRASGGVGINTNAPSGATLNVSGAVRATTFQGDGSGLFNVSAGALANYIFAFNSGVQSVTTGNTFQDVNSATDAQLSGWTHATGTSQYTNAQTGLYLIQYFGQVESTLANGTNAQMRLTLNGSEISGSRSVVSFTPLQFTTVSKSIIASVNGSDILAVQFTGSGTGVRLTGSGNATLTVTRIQ